MAELNPSTSATYVTNAQFDAIPHDDPDALASAGSRYRIQRFRHYVKHFTNVAASTDYSSGIRNPVAVAWQANGTGDDVAAIVGSSHIRMNGSGTEDGWLHILATHSGDELTTTDTGNSPTARAGSVNGYVQPGSMYASHRNASPDALTNAVNGNAGAVLRTAGLRLRIVPFEVTGTGDTYSANTLDKMPGLVAVAWGADQAGNDRCAATLNEDGDVIFTIPGATAEGWLWCWTRGGRTG